MRIALILAPIVFMACFIVHGCEYAAQKSQQEDLSKIEQLHEIDIKASKEQDYDKLLTLCTEDCVLLPVDQEPIIGMEAIRKWMKQNQAANENLQVTKYLQDFKEVKVVDDWAFEWGTFRGEAISMGSGETFRQSGKIMRILKRQPDGSWKVARSIWNADTTPAQGME